MATYYWVGGSGTWDASTTTNWSATSGGAGGAGVPNNTDTVIFDSASGTGTCTTASGSACAIATLNSSTLGLTLGANHTMSGTFTLTLGVLSLGANNLRCDNFSSTNANVRSIAFGTGNIELTGNAKTVWNTDNATNLSLTGSLNVNLIYAGGTGTRGIFSGFTGGLEANSPNINVTAGTDTVLFYGARRYGSINLTGFSGIWSGESWQFTVFGSLIIPAGTPTATTAGFSGPITFAATSGVKDITTNGVVIPVGLTFNGVGGTFRLQGNVTTPSTYTTTLTNGTLDLNNQSLSVGLFSSSNANVRTLAFGTGNVTVTGNNAAIWNVADSTNLTITGSRTVNSTYSGAIGTRTIFAGAGTVARAFDYNITAGTDIVTTAGVSGLRSLNFTGFSGTFSNAARIIFGDLTISTGMTLTAGTNATNFFATTTAQITSNGKTMDFPLVFDGVGGVFSFQDNLTVGSTRAITFNNGALVLNNNTLSTGTFSSSNSNVRSIAFGTGNITLTGNNTTIWNTATSTSFTYTGTPTINSTYSGSTGTRTLQVGSTTGGTESNALNFVFNAGTDAITFGSASKVKNLTLTGWAGILTSANMIVYGNYTLSSGTSSASTGALTFAATSGVQQITTAGVVLDRAILFNGIGGTFAFQDALTQGATRTFTITNGTVQLKNGVTSTVGSFVTSGTNQKFLQSTTPGSQAILSQSSGTVTAQYLTISDSFATGGADWEAFYANNNVDAGNNSNWDFGATPILGTEYTYTLRSFTQPRRF